MEAPIRLLGEVEVRVAGQTVDLGHARQRCVLAVLLADERQRVSTDQLIHRVWGEQPPQRARHALHSYLSRLRRVLSDAGIAGIPRARDGYSIEVDPASVDLHRFRDAVTRSRSAPSAEARERLLAEALGLWRGEWAFADLDTPWLADLRQVLARERLEAQAARNEILLGRGEGAQLLPELFAAADANPLDERLTEQLMWALVRCGRPAEALERYRRIRRSLVTEIGTEPGPALRTLHQRILAGELDLIADPAVGRQRIRAGDPVVRGVDVGPVPRQLPAAPSRFVGRDEQLAALTTALLPVGQQPVTAVISGMGGVGKTTLALHWAYQHLADFPDGQLYINLRGFDPTAPPLEPATVIRAFLDAVGAAPGSLTDLDAQVARYRTVITPRRLLVLLDNARDADQVRPLLPGAGNCRTLVTSRHDLTGLVATDDARPVPLGPVHPDEAYQLLAARLGDARTAAEPQAVRQIIDSCDGLPLALAVVAGRASVRPALPLARLADELSGSGRLDVLAAGDRAADVRAVFAGSYRTLPPTSARLFRLLAGVHPGPDVDPGAAAALGGLPEPTVRRVLTELVQTHLLDEHLPGRFALHDLLRAYAAERASAEDTAEVPAATERMVDHYLALALAASRSLSPHREPVAGLPSGADRADRFAGPDAALDWFSTEYPILRALIDLAVAAGLDTHAWQLTWAMTLYFDRSGRWYDWAVTQAVGVAAAIRAGDLAAEAHLVRGEGRLHTRLRHFPQAQTKLRRALALFRRLDNRVGEGRVQLELGWLADRQGAFDRALRHDARALRLFRDVGHRVGEARALHAVGWDSAQLGRYRAALRACQQALAVQEELGAQNGAASSWDSIGQIHHRLGRPDRAMACYERALELRRRLRDRHNEALTLDHLGDALRATGRSAAAQRAYRRADDIYQALCLPSPRLTSPHGW